MTTYRRIGAVMVSGNIMKCLANLREPASAADIAKLLELPYGTVMSHLSTLEDMGWVRRIGEHWDIGMGLALFWARKKAQLEGGIARMKADLEEIDV